MLRAPGHPLRLGRPDRAARCGARPERSSGCAVNGDAPLAAADSSVVRVVDTMLASLGALCIELDRAGFTVLADADGASALARLDFVSPDAIWLDALMPGQDGFDVCRRIKANPAWSHIPVIFMAGLSETSHIVRGFDTGGVDHVVEPLRAASARAPGDPLTQCTRSAHGTRRDRHRRSRRFDVRRAPAARVAFATGLAVAGRVSRRPRRCGLHGVAGPAEHRQRRRAVHALARSLAAC